MHLCLFLKKSVNSLQKIILQLYNRSNVSYYQTVRMSDLRDELYEDTLTNSDTISLQNEKNDLKCGKKRIVKIKIKMSDVKNHIETENSALRDMYILECNENDGSLETKTLGRIQKVETMESSDINPGLDCNENVSINDNNITSSIKYALAFQKCDTNNEYEIIEKRLENELEDSCDEYIEALLIREQRNFEKLSAELRRVNQGECLADKQEKCGPNTVGVEEGQSIYLDIDNNDSIIGGDIENIEGPSNESMYESYTTAILDDRTINSDIENSCKEETNYKTIIESEETEEKKESLPNATIYEEIQSLTNEEVHMNNSLVKEDKSTCPDIQYKKEIENKMTTSDAIWKTAHKNYLLLDNNNSEEIAIVHDKKPPKLLYGNISTMNIQENVPDEEKIKDSLIIRDIVMKKYEEILSKFKQKRLQKKNNKNRQSVCEVKGKMELNQKIDRPTTLAIQDLQNNQDFLQLYNKTPDSGLDATRESDFSKRKSGESFKSSDETLKYSPTVFLKEALGDDYINITYDSEQENSEHRYHTPLSYNHRSTGRSIGSSEISTLISTPDGVDSLYSTIDKSQKKGLTNLKKKSLSRPLFKSTSSEMYIYESIDKFKVNSKCEELHHTITVQCAIIAQASKALSLCRESSKFFGSIPHLEAEKCLLLAMHRKRIFENQLNREYEQMECEQCYGTVNMENLVFSLNTTKTTAETDDGHYFMCLIHSDVTLLASDIVSPERNGGIIFKGSFQFNNLTSDFKIYIKIYSMILEKDTRKKRPYISPNKICSTWRNGKIFNKHIDRLSEMSSFSLCGIYKLGISDLYNINAFTLEKVSPNGSLSENFTVDIQSSIEITNHINGFLTIGTTNILWNRRWCSLEGHFLKYWNYPSDENDKEPIGIFDLSNCTTPKVIKAEKAICSRPRTVTLEILSERGTVMQYFLQADNMVEYEEWKRQLNSVLTSLNNWKCLKC